MKKLLFMLEKELIEMNKFLKSLNWDKIFTVFSVYIGGSYGLYYMLTTQPKFWTYVWVYTVFLFGGIGLGPGVHRYFSHKSYKATRGFKIFLIMCQTIAGQYSIIFWSTVHRCHHKFTDTEKDPTNIKRGFLFSHFYCFFRHSPEAKKAIDSMDISDLTSDKDVMFQYRHIVKLSLFFCVFLPTIIPIILWDETILISFWSNMFRWLLNYNQMCSGNSIMHIYGKRPYDKHASAAESLFSIIYTYGEGFHNYHHTFPWDYNAAEFGDIAHFNFASILLDIMAALGLVYDRKVVTQSMIDRRKARTGDGTHWLSSEEVHKTAIWGYGDRDMDVDDKEEIKAACLAEDKSFGGDNISF